MLDHGAVSDLSNTLLHLLDARGVSAPFAAGALLLSVSRLVASEEHTPEEEIKMLEEFMSMFDVYWVTGRVH